MNKLRAEHWARQRGQVVFYAIATDKVSSRALHDKPDIAQDKLPWSDLGWITDSSVLRF